MNKSKPAPCGNCTKCKTGKLHKKKAGSSMVWYTCDVCKWIKASV